MEAKRSIQKIPMLGASTETAQGISFKKIVEVWRFDGKKRRMTWIHPDNLQGGNHPPIATYEMDTAAVFTEGVLSKWWDKPPLELTLEIVNSSLKVIKVDLAPKIK